MMVKWEWDSDEFFSCLKEEKSALTRAILPAKTQKSALTRAILPG